MDTTIKIDNASEVHNWSEHRKWLNDILAFSGLTYAVGFLTIMSHTAGFGLPVIEILKPLNLWVGLFPTLILYFEYTLCVKLFTLVAVEWKGKLLVLATIAAGIAAMSWLVMMYFVWDKALRSAGSDGLPIFLLVLFLFIIVIFFFVVAEETKRFKELVFYLTLTLGSVGTVAGYALWVYPALPQRYGFGGPARVTLIMERDSADALGATTTSCTAAPSTVVKCDAQVLYMTDKQYVIRFQNSSSVAWVNNSTIKAVLWRSTER